MGNFPFPFSFIFIFPFNLAITPKIYERQDLRQSSMYNKVHSIRYLIATPSTMNTGVSRVQTELCVMGARQLTIGATLAVEMGLRPIMSHNVRLLFFLISHNWLDIVGTPSGSLLRHMTRRKFPLNSIWTSVFPTLNFLSQAPQGGKVYHWVFRDYQCIQI